MVRSRLTYANVVSTLALFFALAGGGYAFVQLPPHSVGAAQLRPHSVDSLQLKDGAVGTAQLHRGSVFSDDLAALSVGSGQLQPGSVTSYQLAPGAVGARAVEPGSLLAEDFSSDEVAPRLFAHVLDDGTVGSSAGVVNAFRQGTGSYVVSFDQDVTDCALTATLQSAVPAGITAGPAGPEGVLVHTYLKSGTLPSVDADFYLVVTC